MTTLNLQVAANDDDGTSHTGATWGNTFVAAGWYGPGSLEYIGVASFAGVTIPQGATISSATLTLRPNTLDAGAITYALKVLAQKVASASQPATGNNPIDQAWAYTTAQTNYSGTPTVGTDLALDVTAVVQEIINQGSWASGNRTNLVLRNNGMTGATDKRVEFDDYGTVGATTAAKLSITYATSTPPTSAFSTSVSLKTVTLTDSSTQGTNPITSYDTDWGDGSAHMTTASGSHTYSVGGSYSVVHTVSDGTTPNAVTHLVITKTRNTYVVQTVGGNSASVTADVPDA